MAKENSDTLIPICSPLLSGMEEEYVTECVRSGWISSSGKYVREFEEVFSKYCGAGYGVACTSGTTALHLALAAAGVGPGDEVIIPDFTMIATSNAVIYTGATPALVDSEPATWNMDVALVERCITPRTRTILPVHIFGHTVDMDPLISLANKYGLMIIEDAAEAHGAEYKGKKTGSIGRMGCFSFYANKMITTGEGGMVVTDDPELAERLRSLRDLCFGVPRFEHRGLGFNYRMTSLQAAFGLGQMARIEEFVESRRSHAALYRTLLKDIRGISTQPEMPWAKNVYWMFGIILEDDFGMAKDGVCDALLRQEIETRSFFYPIHNQPVYKQPRENNPRCDGEYPVADRLYSRGILLPSGSGLTTGQIHRVVEAIAALAR